MKYLIKILCKKWALDSHSMGRKKLYRPVTDGHRTSNALREILRSTKPYSSRSGVKVPVNAEINGCIDTDG
jgi:hypothetical protein